MADISPADYHLLLMRENATNYDWLQVQQVWAHETGQWATVQVLRSRNYRIKASSAILK